ncbi:TetR/AcrR family transcriptional regulator [Parasedimentitalea huanghaiensis]|uniref:TetR family transcriptional regulator n=1 Tax=Parasedimentitalea huanghaiensis TaxID=2682100 RepID=A0A6L6WB73_9RHOB|nr:TetR/AcrR family transcriptional regulator [Zongyanglinia huanghaiensis]MVO15073.1 TetR family transcriptional regulator [Zongyanglinia huanghaiensis]
MSTTHTNTRTKILQATLDLLFSEPPAKTRMSDVATQAGVSRQAVYLHFKNRADLLIAATHFLDEKLDTDARLAASRTAQSGRDRLQAFVTAWGNYIPEIHRIAKVLISMSETDEAAASAWENRMQDMREGCAAAIDALNADGTLSPDFNTEDATDVLWTMLSVHNWEHSTGACGWSQKKYLTMLALTTQKLFYADPVKAP